jgi:hypothetical protein
VYALASLLLVPFVLALWRVSTRRGSVLRLIGGQLLIAGAVGNGLGEGVLAYSAWGMHGAGVPAAAQIRYFDLLDSSNAALPIGFVAIPVLSLGLLLLVLGVLLARVVPVWLPVAVIIGAAASGFVGTGPVAAVGLLWALSGAATVWLVAARRDTGS